MKIRNKVKYPIYASKKKKKCFEKHVDLLLLGEEGKMYYVLMKYFNTFMCDYTYIVEENIFVVTVCKLLVQKNIKISC